MRLNEEFRLRIMEALSPQPLFGIALACSLEEINLATQHQIPILHSSRINPAN